MRRLLIPAALILAAPFVASAQQTPSCGSTITESITLTEDCSSSALTITGAVVDLGGHTMAAVIQIYGGTIRNGRVVGDINSSGGRLEDLVIDGGRIHASSSSSSIARSSFINGSVVVCTDVGLGVDHSKFIGPSYASAISGSNCSLGAGHNTFSGYSYAFFSDIAAYPISLTDNVIDGGGIHITSLSSNASMRIRGNQISSASSDGIFVSEYSRSGSVKLQLEASNNTVIGNAGNGIRIINTHGGNVTVTSNLAVGNFALGIDAPNVHDGGGNRAGANGDPAECVGVPCSGVDLPSELGMCLIEQRQCEDALGACNSAVIGANGDFNGDGVANIVDSTLFRRSLAGSPVP